MESRSSNQVDIGSLIRDVKGEYDRYYSLHTFKVEPFIALEEYFNNNAIDHQSAHGDYLHNKASYYLGFYHNHLPEPDIVAAENYLNYAKSTLHGLDLLNTLLELIRLNITALILSKKTKDSFTSTKCKETIFKETNEANFIGQKLLDEMGPDPELIHSQARLHALSARYLGIIHASEQELLHAEASVTMFEMYDSQTVFADFAYIYLVDLYSKYQHSNMQKPGLTAELFDKIDRYFQNKPDIQYYLPALFYNKYGDYLLNTRPQLAFQTYKMAYKIASQLPEGHQLLQTEIQTSMRKAQDSFAQKQVGKVKATTFVQAEPRIENGKEEEEVIEKASTPNMKK